MKKLLVILMLGMFLISYASALSPVISEEEYIGLQSKSIIEDDCKMKIDGKIGKEKIVYYQYDFECILLRGIKQTRELQTKVNELELRIVQLENIVSQLTGQDVPKIETENERQDEALCSIKLFSWCLIK
jgi:hypothetical protein